MKSRVTAAGGASLESETCERCGEPLPRLSRRREKVCRVCATQAAQGFFRQALTQRRRRVGQAVE
jgi:uncharacterized Zn finger protein (UPF0148 family)